MRLPVIVDGRNLCLIRRRWGWQVGSTQVWVGQYILIAVLNAGEVLRNVPWLVFGAAGEAI